MNFTQIRSAEVSDAGRLHFLARQLGHSPSLETVLLGLQATLFNPHYDVVVVEREGLVVGWMTLARRYRIESEASLKIEAIAIDKPARGLGYGRILVNYALERAKQLGLKLEEPEIELETRLTSASQLLIQAI